MLLPLDTTSPTVAAAVAPLEEPGPFPLLPPSRCPAVVPDLRAAPVPVPAPAPALLGPPDTARARACGACASALPSPSSSGSNGTSPRCVDGAASASANAASPSSSWPSCSCPCPCPWLSDWLAEPGPPPPPPLPNADATPRLIRREVRREPAGFRLPVEARARADEAPAPAPRRPESDSVESLDASVAGPELAVSVERVAPDAARC